MTALIIALQNALGNENGGGVIHHPDDLLTYECDAFTLSRARPLAVVLPTTTDQVVQTINICRQHNIAVIPRGAATGLAGGIVPVTPSVQISTARMNKILQIDLRNRIAHVETGVTNLALSTAVAASL